MITYESNFPKFSPGLSYLSLAFLQQISTSPKFHSLLNRCHQLGPSAQVHETIGETAHSEHHIS